jgi:hypothetical protein
LLAIGLAVPLAVAGRAAVVEISRHLADWGVDKQAGDPGN